MFPQNQEEAALLRHLRRRLDKRSDCRTAGQPRVLLCTAVQMYTHIKLACAGVQVKQHYCYYYLDNNNNKRECWPNI